MEIIKENEKEMRKDHVRGFLTLGDGVAMIADADSELRRRRGEEVVIIVPPMAIE